MGAEEPFFDVWYLVLGFLRQLTMTQNKCPVKKVVGSTSSELLCLQRRISSKFCTISRNQLTLGGPVSPGVERPQDVKASKPQNKRSKIQNKRT